MAGWQGSRVAGRTRRSTSGEEVEVEVEEVTNDPSGFASRRAV